MAQIHNKKKRMPLILPDELAWEWIQDGLSPKRIHEITQYQFPSAAMEAWTIRKDFREIDEPREREEYAELSAL
jgi:hypothetical protein